jgi:hypothetical protein
MTIIVIYLFRAFDHDRRNSMPESTSGELLKNSDMVREFCAGVRFLFSHSSGETISATRLPCRVISCGPFV